MQVSWIQNSLLPQTNASEMAMFLTLVWAGLGFRLFMIFVASVGIRELNRSGMLQLFATMPGGLLEWWRGRKRAFQRLYSWALLPILLCALWAVMQYATFFSGEPLFLLKMILYLVGWTIALICELNAIHALRVVDALLGKRMSFLRTVGVVLLLPWMLKIFVFPLFIVPFFAFILSWLLHVANALVWQNVTQQLEYEGVQSLRLRLLERA